MKLNKLKQKGKMVFNTEDARKIGISRQLIAHYLHQGLIIRLSHGVYRLEGTESIDFEELIKEVLAAIPNSVVGLKTALRIYNLTEELPSEIDIIVPKENVPKRRLENVRLYRIKGNIYRHDVKQIHGLPVTSPERTVIDLLRFNEPMSLILEVLAEAKQKSIAISIPKLKKMSKMFRVQGKMKQLLEAWV